MLRVEPERRPDHAEHQPAGDDGDGPDRAPSPRARGVRRWPGPRARGPRSAGRPGTPRCRTPTARSRRRAARARGRRRSPGCRRSSRRRPGEESTWTARSRSSAVGVGMRSVPFCSWVARVFEPESSLPRPVWRSDAPPDRSCSPRPGSRHRALSCAAPVAAVPMPASSRRAPDSAVARSRVERLRPGGDVVGAVVQAGRGRGSPSPPRRRGRRRTARAGWPGAPVRRRP